VKRPARRCWTRSPRAHRGGPRGGQRRAIERPRLNDGRPARRAVAPGHGKARARARARSTRCWAGLPGKLTIRVDPPDASQAPRKHPKLGVGLGGPANAFSGWTGTGPGNRGRCRCTRGRRPRTRRSRSGRDDHHGDRKRNQEPGVAKATRDLVAVPAQPGDRWPAHLAPDRAHRPWRRAEPRLADPVLQLLAAHGVADDSPELVHREAPIRSGARRSVSCIENRQVRRYSGYCE
jgi:hypothetical protein